MIPKILIVIDKKEWCFDNIAKQLIKYLSDKYNFTVLTDAELSKKNIEQFNYDVILLFVWASFIRYFRNFSRKNIISIGIYDHLSWKQSKNIFQQINDIHSFYVGNEKLKQEIKEIKNIRCYICDDGVNTTLFSPKKYIIGWAGKSLYWGSINENNSSVKGLELIKKAINDFEDVELLIQDATQNQLPHNEMKEKFYNKIDCLINASLCEGTPNPVLEALSCGLPVITTEVGIVPQINNDIYYKITRDINSIKDAILKVKGSNDKRRKEMLLWDWSIKIKNYDTLIQDIIDKK